VRHDTCTQCRPNSFFFLPPKKCQRREREGSNERGKDEGKEGVREGGRESEREGGREGGREGRKKERGGTEKGGSEDDLVGRRSLSP